MGRVFSYQLALDPLAEADVLVIGTEWPEFREKARELISIAKPNLMVIDANRHLQATLASAGLKYVAVGTPTADIDK